MIDRPSIEQIARAVCVTMGCRWRGGVMSKQRGDRLAIARALIVQIARGYEYTLDQVSNSAGYSSPSGAHYACERIEGGEYDESIVLEMLRANSVGTLKKRVIKVLKNRDAIGTRA